MSTPIKIVYFGSPDFSAQILEHLIATRAFQIVGVVTNPDRPTGRHQVLTPSPVAKVALKHHLPLFRPDMLDENNRLHIKLLGADLFLTAAFGKIIPESWLSTPRLNSLNVHFSLLPKYRGALCVSEAIRHGDSQTGVSLIKMDPELDHGPIIGQIKQAIDLDDDVMTLTKSLTDKTKILLDKYLPLYIEGQLTPKPQDHSQATFTPSTTNRTRASALVPWEMIQLARKGNHANITHALIQSLNPQPGAWTEITEKTQSKIQLKILKTKLVDDKLEILDVQVPGKSATTWKQFAAGHSNLL